MLDSEAEEIQESKSATKTREGGPDIVLRDGQGLEKGREHFRPGKQIL